MVAVQEDVEFAASQEQNQYSCMYLGSNYSCETT